MSLTNKVIQFDQDSDKVHAWVHGPATGAGSTITTDSGTVRTPAKFIADKENEVNLVLHNLPLLAGSEGASLVGYLSTGAGAAGRTVQNALLDHVSVKDFGAVGDGLVNDTNAIELAESSAHQELFLPSGLYITTLLSVAKTYYGPGKIQFSDGYQQFGVDFDLYPPRNVEGSPTIHSPADLILSPNGNVDFDGKRVLNIADPVGLLDCVNLRTLRQEILNSASTAEVITQTRSNYVPIVSGATVAGSCTYTTQAGRCIITGTQVFISLRVVWTGHTGTGAIDIQLPEGVNITGGIGNIGHAIGDVPRTAGEQFSCFIVNNKIKFLTSGPGSNASSVQLPVNGILEATIISELN